MGLLLAASADNNPLDLDSRVSSEEIYLDMTCLKANIHFPVDWRLLYDGMRSLIASIKVIRRHGLKHRIPDPSTLLRRINRLSMEMTHTRRKKDSRKNRKKYYDR